ncbi:MAG: prepilin-type N-terminal cleavage/methylation domain-containing protein, partial [SAR324 cluster bacterium]|nr:prepilin-type N-terminal cleavage/methylation domain-containing protein [SAR324 cluster bacterium]
MRISSYCGGFTLYEVMISITAVGIISWLITLSLLPLLDRAELVNTLNQFKDNILQAKWQALTKHKSH